MPPVHQCIDGVCVEDEPHLARPGSASLVGQSAEQAHVAGDFGFIFRGVQAAPLVGEVIEKLAKCLVPLPSGEFCPERRIHLGGQALPAASFDCRDEVGVEGD
jgi:hypothetical protein